MVVVDAVDHRRIALDVGMPAGARAALVQNRPGDVLGQAALDLEHDRLALLLIGLHRLLLEKLVEVAVAIAVVVAGGPASALDGSHGVPEGIQRGALDEAWSPNERAPQNAGLAPIAPG